MSDEEPRYHALDTYRPTHCDVARQVLSEGNSITSLAARLDVTYRTICHWRKKFPDFDWACEVGVTKGLANWEAIGKDSIHDTKFNNVMYIFTLKSQYKVRDTDPPEDTKQSQPTAHILFGMEGDKHRDLVERVMSGNNQQPE